MTRRSIGLFAALLLIVLAPWAQAQPVPFHEQDRRWYAIAPDTLAQSRFYDARSVYQDGRRVLFAASKHGLLKSTSGGDSWRFVHQSQDDIVYQVAASPTHPDTLYAAGFNHIYKSIDGGETWKNMTAHVTRDTHVAHKECGSSASSRSAAVSGWFKGIDVSPYDPDFVFAISDDNYTIASRDGGETWYRHRWSSGCLGALLTFALSPKTPGRVFVNALADGDPTVYEFAISDDWGDAFESIDVRVNDVGSWSMSLFVDTSEAIHSGSHVSHDLGETWEQREGGRSFDDMFEDGGFGIWLGSGYREEVTGLYAGYDRGQRWHRVANDLLLDPSRLSVTLDRRDSTVYVATDRGLYAYARPGALDTPTEQPDVVPEALRLEAYPNPARERATVTYALPEAGWVRLAAYDVLGREVAVLVDERRAAGEHRAHFEAARLPAGTYFVRLLAPEGVQTRPLVVVR